MDRLIPPLIDIITDYIGFKGILEREFTISHRNDDYKTNYIYKLNKRCREYPRGIKQILKHNNNFLILYKNNYLISYYPNFKIDKILYHSHKSFNIFIINHKYLAISHDSRGVSILNIYQNKVEKKYISHRVRFVGFSTLYIHYSDDEISQIFCDHEIHPKTLIDEMENSKYVFPISKNKILYEEYKYFGCPINLKILDIKSGNSQNLNISGLGIKHYLVIDNYLVYVMINNTLNIYNLQIQEKLTINVDCIDILQIYKMNELSVMILENHTKNNIKIYGIPDLTLMHTFPVDHNAIINFIDNKLYVCENNTIKIYN